MNKGTVIKSTGSWYTVRNEDGTILNARIKGKFRIKGIKTTNPIAVGDNVHYSLEESGNGIIEKIEDRKNYIIRKSINLSKQAHIIAANIDTAFLFVTLKEPFTPLGFIDRFLTTAEAYHIPTVLLFNKIDIYSKKELELMKKAILNYERIGYQCYTISAAEKTGLDPVKQLMHGNVNLLSGNSGSGKSTFANAIDPSLDLKTNKVSSYHEKGQHTTTFAEMHSTHQCGFIVDTPGIKGLGVINIPKEEIAHYFLEMRNLLPECKFNNCLHINEPKCAVKKALENGEIQESRYNSYLNIYRGDEENYRIQTVRQTT